jgi:hypoxanthine phosphoribosyltransferase
VTVTAEHARQVWRDADCLHDQAAVERALDRMAGEITQALGESNPLLLCVMNGGLVAAGQLLTRLHFPLQVDYLHATRYRGDVEGAAELHWLVRPQIPLDGRDVLVIDDILDEGRTLAGILDYCRQHDAASVRSAVLVMKHHDRRDPRIHADFVGVEVEDRYVFGYGMDYKEYLRNVPGIYAVKGL